MKSKNYLFIFLNLLIAISYYYINYIPIPKQYFNYTSLFWNVILGIIVAFIFIRKEFISSLKSISLKWIILGLSLTSFTCYIANYLYSTYVTKPIFNNFYYGGLENIFLFLPIIILGKEIIVTNLTTSFMKIGFNFWITTFIIAILFAFWYVKDFGLIPLQLIAIISPIRISLNYTFKESKSLWTVFIVHYLFVILTFFVFNNHL